MPFFVSHLQVINHLITFLLDNCLLITKSITKISCYTNQVNTDDFQDEPLSEMSMSRVLIYNLCVRN